ncbi:hypothetical protein EVA_07766 [gut metagenome]|uniref:Uncharacterized protein n=1 Tax=gut metagenome TaxID=749906 RepID=J9GBA7_9ZZZZ
MKPQDAPKQSVQTLPIYYLIQLNLPSGIFYGQGH